MATSSNSSSAQPQQQELAQARQTTVDLLKQARREANCALVVAEDTTVHLRQQGESIDRTDKTVDQMEYNLRLSDRILKGMSGWTGMVSSWFAPAVKPPKQEESPPPAAGKKAAVPASAAVPTGSGRPASAPSAGGKSALLAGTPSGSRGATGQQQATVTTFGGLTVEEDKLLDGLASDVEALRHQALTHREVLDDHNRRLEALSTKVDNVSTHMKSTTNKVKRTG